jgi:ribosomal-protein-alanine N-acetyltransferase
VAGEAAKPGRRDVVGFILSRRAAGEAEILTIVVQPNRRRDGIGRDLMKAHLGRLGALGVSSVFLEVDEHNAAARALYSGLGFEEVGARAAYFRQADGQRSAALILRCPL